MTNEFTLDDLVTRSGLTIRTVRFYIQEGLLEGPDTRGRFSLYSQRHLDRLEVIKLLKELRLPLVEIRKLLDLMSPDEIKQIHAAQDMQNLCLRESRPEDSKLPNVSNAGARALEYIRNLEALQKNIQIKNDASGLETLSSDQEEGQHEKSIQFDCEQQNWRRIIVREGIEVHLLENQIPEDEQKIKKLLEFLGELFEDKPQKGQYNELKE